MRRTLTLLAALSLGTAPLTAGATTAPTLTFTQQARKADVIVRATLGPATRVKEGEITWVVYPLTVTETVAGDPATLPQREGKPALYLLDGVEGLPELREGQEAFLLLYSRRLDSPLVGFSQGLYPIENGQVARPGQAGSANASGTAATAGITGAPASATSTPTPSAPASGTAPPTTGTGTPAPAGTPATASPSTPTTGTAAPPASTAPASTDNAASAPATTSSTPPTGDAIESDPARFRDALRAARGAQ